MHRLRLTYHVVIRCDGPDCPRIGNTSGFGKFSDGWLGDYDSAIFDIGQGSEQRKWSETLRWLVTEFPRRYRLYPRKSSEEVRVMDMFKVRPAV